MVVPVKDTRRNTPFVRGCQRNIVEGNGKQKAL